MRYLAAIVVVACLSLAACSPAAPTPTPLPPTARPPSGEATRVVPPTVAPTPIREATAVPTPAPTRTRPPDVPGSHDLAVVPRPPTSVIVGYRLVPAKGLSAANGTLEYAYDASEVSPRAMAEYYAAEMPALGYALIESAETDKSYDLRYGKGPQAPELIVQHNATVQITISKMERYLVTIIISTDWRRSVEDWEPWLVK